MIDILSLVGGEPWILLPVEPDGEMGDWRPLPSRLLEADLELSRDLHSRGIECARGSDFAAAVSVFNRADELLQSAPELKRIVGYRVKEVVLLRAPDASYDVSHSEPRWPTRIFVSVPARSPLQGLRIVESVIHEAMHLNLTNLEHHTPLVAYPRLLHSPWRGEARPASGVLHGLYVFCCILRFFRTLQVDLGICSERESRIHVERRCGEITADVNSIDRDALVQSLTLAGANLAEKLFAWCEDRSTARSSQMTAKA